MKSRSVRPPFEAALFSLIGLAACVLGACTPMSPDAAICRAKPLADDKAVAKLAACNRVIASWRCRIWTGLCR
jgi:hypothetical protein